jgi:hypothetical protein
MWGVSEASNNIAAGVSVPKPNQGRRPSQQDDIDVEMANVTRERRGSSYAHDNASDDVENLIATRPTKERRPSLKPQNGGTDTASETNTDRSKSIPPPSPELGNTTNHVRRASNGGTEGGRRKSVENNNNSNAMPQDAAGRRQSASDSNQAQQQQQPRRTSNAGANVSNTAGPSAAGPRQVEFIAPADRNPSSQQQQQYPPRP